MFVNLDEGFVKFRIRAIDAQSAATGPYPMISLLSMFALAFGAATLLPLQSEILFVALQLQGTVSLTALVIVASIGNTLGSVVNYILGYQVERFVGRRWFPATPEQMTRAHVWYDKWGVWTLLLSWAPLGDVITVIAGIMRTKFWLFVLLVGIAKTLRYVVLAMITAGVLSL